MTALLGYGRLTDPWSTSGIPSQYRHGLWHAIYLKKGGSLEHLLHENPTYPSGGKGLILHRQSFYGGSAGMYRENYIEFVDDSYHTSQTTAYKADGFGPGYYPEEYFDGWGDIDRNSTPITINGAWGTGPLYHPSDDGLGELRWTIFKEANKFYWPEYLDVVGAEAPWHNMTEPAKKAWLPKGSLENYQKGFLYYAPAQAQVEVVGFGKASGCGAAQQDLEIEVWSTENIELRTGVGTTVAKYATNNENYGQAYQNPLKVGTAENSVRDYYLSGRVRVLFSQGPIWEDGTTVENPPVQYQEYNGTGTDGLSDWLDLDTSDALGLYASATCVDETLSYIFGAEVIELIGSARTGYIAPKYAASVAPQTTSIGESGELVTAFGSTNAQIWRILDAEGAYVNLQQEHTWAEQIKISVTRDPGADRDLATGDPFPLSEVYENLNEQVLYRTEGSTFSNLGDPLVNFTLNEITREVSVSVTVEGVTSEFSYIASFADTARKIYGGSLAGGSWPFDETNITSGTAISDENGAVSFGVFEDPTNPYPWHNTICTNGLGDFCGTSILTTQFQLAGGACAGASPLDYISLVDRYQGIPEGTKVPIKTLQQLQKVAFEDKANQHSDACCFLHAKAQSSIDVLSRKDGETKFEFFTKEGHNAIGASEIPGVTPLDRTYAVTGHSKIDGSLIEPTYDPEREFVALGSLEGLDIRLTFSESVSEIKIGDEIFDFISNDDIKVWKVGTNLDGKPVGQDWHSPRLENTFQIPAHTSNLFTRVEEDTEDIYDGISAKLYDPNGEFEVAGSQNCLGDNSKFPTLCCVFERGDNVYFITITFQGEIPAITTDLNYFGSNVLASSPINRANEYGSQSGGAYRQWLEPVYLVKD